MGGRGRWRQNIREQGAAEQANFSWLISGETVTLNFLKISMPRMGLATAACRKVDVKSLPWNCTVFLIKTQEGMGGPSAPLRRGLEFWLQGTMLKVAPVSTKHLSLVNSSVKKIKPAFAGKCIAMAVACMGKTAKPKVVRWQISLLTKNRAEYTY